MKNLTQYITESLTKKYKSSDIDTLTMLIYGYWNGRTVDVDDEEIKVSSLIKDKKVPYKGEAIELIMNNRGKVLNAKDFKVNFQCKVVDGSDYIVKMKDGSEFKNSWYVPEWFMDDYDDYIDVTFNDKGQLIDYKNPTSKQLNEFLDSLSRS